MGFYDDKHCADGVSRMVGWRSEIERTFRFIWASKTIESIKNEYANVIDAGCADGLLQTHLHNNAIKRYIGVEQYRPFIEIARAQFPTTDFRTGDALVLPLPSNSVWVALGVSVGNEEMTSIVDLYQRAIDLDAVAFICAIPAGDSYDAALRRPLIPAPRPGWRRTPGPNLAGEWMFVDTVQGVEMANTQHIFDECCSVPSTPGERAALAARLGLTEVVRQLAAAHPTDELVQAARDFIADLK